MKIPYIPDKRIERAAETLLQNYHAAFGTTVFPVPVEHLVEQHLGLAIGFQDLKRKLGEDGLLGATYSGKRLIAIDESLEPDVHPEAMGRFRFTVAHEIGHWLLHEPLRQEGTRPIHLAKDAPEASKSRHELQADRFAAAFLMPRARIEQEWREVGRIKPFLGFDPTNEMARRFQVSEHAMWIQLERLKLLAGPGDGE